MAISPLVAWIGPPSPGNKPGESRYQAARLRNKDGSVFEVGVGDYVHVESGSANPYVARIKELKEKSGKGLVVLQWLYQPSEMPKLKATDTFSNEVFMNNHADESPLETVREAVRIAFKDPRNDLLTKSLLYGDTSLQQVSADPPKYVCMRSYDYAAEVLTPITLEVFQESCVFPNQQHPSIKQLPGASPAPVSVAHRAVSSTDTTAQDSMGMRDMPSHPQNLSNLVNHATTCAGCEQSLCRKMKVVLQHMKRCPGGPACKMCSQYMEIVTEHAKRCRLPAGTCHVPHCHDKKPSTIVEHALDCLSRNLPCQVEDCDSAKKFIRYVWACNDDKCFACQKFQSLLQFHETGCENGCMFPNCPHFGRTLRHALQRCSYGPARCLKCAVVKLLAEMHARRCKLPSQCRFPIHVTEGPNGERRMLFASGLGVPQQQLPTSIQAAPLQIDASRTSSAGSPKPVVNQMGLPASPENDVFGSLAPRSNGSHVQTPLPTATSSQQQVAVLSSSLPPDASSVATRSVPPPQMVVGVQPPPLATTLPAAIRTPASASIVAPPPAETTPATLAAMPAPVSSSTSAASAPASATPPTTTTDPVESSALASSSSTSAPPPTTITTTSTPAKPATASPPIASNKRMKHGPEEEEEKKVTSVQKLKLLVRPMTLLDANSEQAGTKITMKRSIFGHLRQQSGGKDCIRVGPDFQATLPGYSPTRPSIPTSTDTCLWSPDAKTTREDQFKERRKRKSELLSQRGTILNVVVSGGPRSGMWVRIVEPMKTGSTVLRVVPMQLTWPSSLGPGDFVVSVSGVMFEVDAGSPDVRFPETLDEAVMYDLYIQNKYEEGSEQLAKLREEFGTCLARGVPEIVSDWTRRNYIAYIHEKFVSADVKHLSEKTGKTILELNEFLSCVPDKPKFIYRSGLSCAACRKTPSDRLIACERFTVCKTCFCVDCANQENEWRRKRAADKNGGSDSTSESKVEKEDTSILSENAKGFVCYMCDLQLRPQSRPTRAFSVIQNCGMDFNPEWSWVVGRSEKRLNMIKIAQEFKRIPFADASSNKTTTTTTTTNANTSPSESSSVVSPSPPATPIHSTSLPPPTPSSVASSSHSQQPAAGAAAEPQQSPVRAQPPQQSSSIPVKHQPPQPPSQPPPIQPQQQSPVRAQPQHQTTGTTVAARVPEMVAASGSNAKPLPMFLDNESIIAAYDEKRLSALEAVNLIRNLLIEKSTKTLRSLATASNTTVQLL